MREGTCDNVHTAGRKDGAQAAREKVCSIDITLLQLGDLTF